MIRAVSFIIRVDSCLYSIFYLLLSIYLFTQLPIYLITLNYYGHGKVFFCPTKVFIPE